jgi:hypothetical protein
MDEGLTLKMCTSILYATIAEATDLYKMNTTSVSHTYLLLCVINVCLYVPFNVAFNVTLMLYLMFILMLHLMFLLMLHLMFLVMWHLMFLLLLLLNLH